MERILTVFPSSANPLGPLCLDDAVENLSEFGVLGDHMKFRDRLGFPAGGPAPAHSLPHPVLAGSEVDASLFFQYAIDFSTEFLMVEAIGMDGFVDGGIDFYLPVIFRKGRNGEDAGGLADRFLCLLCAPGQFGELALVVQIDLGLGGEHLRRGEGLHLVLSSFPKSGEDLGGDPFAEGFGFRFVAAKNDRVETRFVDNGSLL